MQIYNNVQTPRFSPNFGKVRISENALNQLKDFNVSSMKMVEDITKAVEMCKNTNKFHINIDVVENELKANIFSDPNAYFGLFTKIRSGDKFTVTKYGRYPNNVINSDTIMLGDNIKSYYGIHKLNTTNGETTYSAWGYKPMDTPKYILDLAEITVELDKQDKYVQERKKMNQDVREQCAKELETAVDKLKEML